MSFSLQLVGSDFTIVGGRFKLSHGADAIRDRLYTALSTQLGEWFLDLEDGVPYYGEGGILGGKMTEAEVGAIIRRRILLDPGVDRVDSLRIVQSARRNVTVNADVTVRLPDGSTEQITLEV